MKRILPIFLFVITISTAQITSFPYHESFDTVATPNLPLGWTSTTNRLTGGDFISSTTTVRSSPNCVSSTNGRISQSLISPIIDFTGKFSDSIVFYERRTSTHASPLLVEASIGSDTTFAITISDTLKLQSSTAYVKRSFALPETLNGTSNVRFRWRVVADSTAGTSGVIRFDDVTVTVKKAADLALHSFSITPLTPKRGETLSATIGILNRALTGNFSGTVQLFDSLILVASQNFSQSFAANESLAVQLIYPNISAGRHPLTAKLMLSGDEDTTNNSISLVVNAGYQPRTFLINEIMYAPPTGMPEWVEIVNNSADTVVVSGWRISDAGTTRASILPQRAIAPYIFFILTTDTNAFKSFSDADVPLFHAQFSALNNTGDAVVLFDPTGATIDSLMFSSSWGGSSGGKSLERIDTAVASTLQSNWQTSKHPLGATPGAVNSVTQKVFDAAVVMIGVLPTFPVTGDIVTVSSTVKNAGKQSAAAIVFRFYLDANNDSIPSSGEIRHEQTIAVLSPNDSVIVSADLTSLTQGVYRIFASVSFATDDDTTNDLLSFSFSVGIPPQSVVITEIMYAPNGDEPEWIECYNRSGHSISLSGWKISDAGTTRSALTNTATMIPAQSYFIVARDSSFVSYYSITAPLVFAPFSSLNNTTPDAVVLFDERGGRIDSIYYRPAWGGSNGQTLQRFDIFGPTADSANWRSAAPSAGLENIIARKDFDVEIKSIQSLKIANGTRITTTLLNSGRQNAGTLSIRFYHDANSDDAAQQGELIGAANVPGVAAADSVSVDFEWTHALRGKQSVILTVEFSQDQRLTNNTGYVTTVSGFQPQTLVINEIMYEPLSGGAEFVELLNRSSDSIDVAEWNIMDQPGSTGSRAVIPLSQELRIVPPNGYVVIASDSSVFARFSALSGKFVIVNSSLSLGNSGEDIVLVDLTGTQIDSVRYSPSWHLKNITSGGRSLERINPHTQSNDVRNWSSSVAKNGASPAQSNSIYIASVSSNAGLTLNPNPFSPDNDGYEDFLSINYNVPANSSTIRVRIYDVTGRLTRRLVQSEPSSSTGTIIWNGLDDDGHRVRIGMYIILFEAFDNFGGTVKTMKDVAVVGRKL